jgi:hypothetical protein
MYIDLLKNLLVFLVSPADASLRVSIFSVEFT